MEKKKSNDAQGRRNERLLVLAGLLTMLFGFLYQRSVHFQVTAHRIEHLHKLATSRDQYEIRMELGALYTEAGEYDKAIESYKKALPLFRGKGQTNLFFAWEDLNSEDPFDTNMHLGFGEMFERHGLIDQAEMEYRQALALVPHNPDAKRRLIDVREKKRLIPANDPYENAEHKKFKAYIASKWFPPSHKGCLVTRCRVFKTETGDADVQVVGQSGSAAHDRSAVSILKSALYRSPLLGCGIIDCGCMSDGQEKLVAWNGLGEFNICETTFEQQLAYRIQSTVHWINKSVGALSL